MPPTGSPAKPKFNTVYDDIAKAAQETGVPVEVALAAADLETGGTFDPTAAGDRGYFHGGRFVPDSSGPPTSFGEYQLHQGGELGNLSIAAAEDPYTNASTALPHFAAVRKEHPDWTWGQVVAGAQRPADQASYAAVIDHKLAGLRASGMDPRSYFAHISGGAHSKLVANTGDLYSGPSTAGALGGLGVPAFSDSGGVNVTPPPKADDWIAGLDKALNPHIGGGALGLLTDTAGALQLVAVRAGVAIVGVMFLGTGLLLMFGKEIFGGALLAVPGIGEAAGALDAAGVAAKAAHAATVTRRTTRGANAVNRATGKA
jgi:hypothetical protein